MEITKEEVENLKKKLGKELRKLEKERYELQKFYMKAYNSLTQAIESARYLNGIGKDIGMEKESSIYYYDFKLQKVKK